MVRYSEARSANARVMTTQYSLDRKPGGQTVFRESSELHKISPQLNRCKQAPARMPACRRLLTDKRWSISDELWRREFQEYLRMSRLTRRKVGRSDNNDAG
jgi:hypothetical protein